MSNNIPSRLTRIFRNMIDIVFFKWVYGISGMWEESIVHKGVKSLGKNIQWYESIKKKMQISAISHLKTLMVFIFSTAGKLQVSFLHTILYQGWIRYYAGLVLFKHTSQNRLTTHTSCLSWVIPISASTENTDGSQKTNIHLAFKRRGVCIDWTDFIIEMWIGLRLSQLRLSLMLHTVIES